MKWFNALSRLFQKGSNRPKAGLSNSHLVGMYLSQANGKDGYSSEFQQTRERRNGKYSHNRERA
jgi:hypothetical protein